MDPPINKEEVLFYCETLPATDGLFECVVLGNIIDDDVTCTVLFLCPIAFCPAVFGRGEEAVPKGPRALPLTLSPEK
jgi:hypothetical protein